jgi:large subunit ribosomal protein L10
MALTKDQKEQRVAEIKDLLDSSKMTVIAGYGGTSVKQMQALRKLAKDNQTSVKIVKNRLVKIAMSQSDKYKDTDTGVLSSQLLYAFNPNDEAAPAQTLNKYNKDNQTLEFVGAFTSDGEFIGPDDVKALANLPDKSVLQAQLIGTVKAPLSGFVGVLHGNITGVLSVLNARAQSIE